MNIQLLSDLHLESNPHLQIEPVPNADLLVLAGDIGSYQLRKDGSRLPEPDWGLQRFSPLPQFAGWPVPVLFVPGNHEYDGLDFDEAWSIGCATFGYTNHTLMPEALEKWSVGLFERVLPRHLQIIYDLNLIHLKAVQAKWPGDNEKKRICSLIEENGHKRVRMANLSVVGSHTVNGVAALHTALRGNGSAPGVGSPGTTKI